MAQESGVSETNFSDLNAVFQNSSDCITLAKMDTQIIAVNPAYAQLMQQPEHELVGQYFADHIPERYAGEVLQALERATEEEPSSETVEMQAVNPDSRTMMWTNTVLFDNGRPDKILSVGRDVTQLNRALLKAETAAREAEVASQAKSAFIANMSHEVRTPLNAVMGMFQLIQMTADPEKRLEYAAVGLRAADSLLFQLNNILEVTKIEAASVTIFYEECCPRELANTWRSLTLGSIERYSKSVEVVSVLSDELPETVNVDRERLTQVVLNLCDNAAKFTNHGKIEICLSTREESPSSAASLLISVADTGQGIPKEHQTTVLKPFEQGDSTLTRSHGGAGLGLSVCKELVGLMGGTICLESPVANTNLSTRFTLSLPLDGHRR